MSGVFNAATAGSSPTRSATGRFDSRLLGMKNRMTQQADNEVVNEQDWQTLVSRASFATTSFGNCRADHTESLS